MKTELDQNPDLNTSDENALTQTGALSALRLAAHRLSEKRKKPKLKTRDLVGLLLSHSARAWRNSLPRVAVKISVNTPNGTPALRISCPVPTNRF
ncbi:MAG: hypothetical protein ACRCU5_12965 [Rhizobiaceae bacterium]